LNPREAVLALLNCGHPRRVVDCVCADCGATWIDAIGPNGPESRWRLPKLLARVAKEGLEGGAHVVLPDTAALDGAALVPVSETEGQWAEIHVVPSDVGAYVCVVRRDGQPRTGAELRVPVLLQVWSTLGEALRRHAVDTVAACRADAAPGELLAAAAKAAGDALYEASPVARATRALIEAVERGADVIAAGFQRALSDTEPPPPPNEHDERTAEALAAVTPSPLATSNLASAAAELVLASRDCRWHDSGPRALERLRIAENAVEAAIDGVQP
jgi:hypothetical protein